MANAWLHGDQSFKDQLVTQRQEVEDRLKVFDEVEQRLQTAGKATDEWKTVRSESLDLLKKSPSLSADESFARHSSVIAGVISLIARVGDESNLTHDPDIDRKRLIDVLIFQGPELSEALSRARGYGMGVMASATRTEEQVERLNRDAVLVEFLAAKVDDSMVMALESNGAFRLELEAPAQSTSDVVLEAMAEISNLTRGTASGRKPEAYFNALSASVDSIFNLEKRIATSLTGSLNARIALLRREVLQTLAWAAFGLLVMSAFALYIMRDITVTLGRLVDVANRIAIGDLTMPPSSTGRKDELGVLADAFDRMVVALNEMVAVAERIAVGDLSVVVKPRSERDVLGKALANMVGRLSSLVGDVQLSGIQVNTSVNEIAVTAKQQQATATEIAATTTEIGATSKEIAATSRELVRTMTEVSSVAEQSAALAGSGQVGVARMEETMRHVMEAAGVDQCAAGGAQRKGRQHQRRWSPPSPRSRIRPTCSP